MKKVLAAIILLGSTCFVNAQETPENGTTIISSGTYRAYGATAPSHVNFYLMRDYPDASSVTWYTNDNNMWKASINNNGRMTHVYYTNSGDRHVVALPVSITAVPDDIIQSAYNLYGEKVYSISTMTGLNNQTVYHVHLLEDKERHSRWLSASGTEIPIQYLPRN